VRDGVVGGEIGFEGCEFRAQAEAGRAQDCCDSADFGFGDIRRGERDGQ